MRRLSVRVKVTAWYTVFVIILAFVAMFVIFRFSGRILWSQTEEELRENVADFAEDLELSEEDRTVLAEGPFYEDDIVFSVYDKDGKLLDGSVPSSFPKNTVLKSGEVQKIVSGSKQWMTYDAALDFGGGEPIWVRGIAYTSVVSHTEQRLLFILCITLPVLVILAAAGGYIITKRAFAPVEHMRRTADEITKSKDLSRRVSAKDSKGELYDLARTFNGMLGSIEKAFEDEKRFTADASHELRTPVSVMIAQGEYALLEDTPEQEREEALLVMLGQAQKMSLLISRLLMLSREKAKAGQTALERTDPALALSLAAEELKAEAEEKGITLEMEVSDDSMVLAAPDGLTHIFLNLIENAIQYAEPGGHVWLRVVKEAKDVICSVADDGPGIAQAHQEDIFKRFYRGDQARTSQKKSHAGLGLSLVQTLTENYGGAVSVRSREGEGAEFLVRLPLCEGGARQTGTYS